MAPTKEPTAAEGVKEMAALKAEVVATAQQGVHLAEDPQMIHNDPQKEIITGNRRRSSAWLLAPANLHLLSVATARLHLIAGRQQEDTHKQILKVRASRRKGESKIYIYEADEKDLKAIPVNYSKSYAYINLISLLADTRLIVQSGYKISYEINFAEKTDPIYPALVVDLEAPLEKKPMNRRRTSRPLAPEAPAEPE